MFPLIPFIIAVVITILGLIYILSPLDLLPDFIPLLGWADDAFIGLLILGAWLYFLIRWGISSLVYDITTASWQSWAVIGGLGLILFWVIMGRRR